MSREDVRVFFIRRTQQKVAAPTAKRTPFCAKEMETLYKNRRANFVKEKYKRCKLPGKVRCVLCLCRRKSEVCNKKADLSGKSKARVKERPQ